MWEHRGETANTKEKKNENKSEKKKIDPPSSAGSVEKAQNVLHALNFAL